MYAQVRAQGSRPSRCSSARSAAPFGGFDQGLIDALDRDGAPVRVDRRYGYHFGDQRTADPADVAEVWYVGEEGRYTSLLPELPGARLVATIIAAVARPTSASCARCSATPPTRSAPPAATTSSTRSTTGSSTCVMEQQFPNGVPGLSTAKVERITELNRAVGGERIVPVRRSSPSPPTRTRTCPSRIG